MVATKRITYMPKDLEENNKKHYTKPIVFNDFRLINENPLFEGLKIPSTITNIDFKETPFKTACIYGKV